MSGKRHGRWIEYGLSIYDVDSHFLVWEGLVEAENPNAIIFDIMHSIRILSNVLSMALFRVAEYMRGNRFDSPEVAALSMEVLRFVSDLDILNNNVLEKALKMDAWTVPGWSPVLLSFLIRVLFVCYGSLRTKAWKCWYLPNVNDKMNL